MSLRRSSLLALPIVTVVLSSLVSALVACGGAIDSPRGESTDTRTPGAAGSAKTPTTTITPTCAAPRCNPGDVTEPGIAFCPPGATCYDRSACGQTVHCTSQLGCGSDPTCPPGYDRVASCLSGGTPDCMQQTICGQTIACEVHTAECDGVPMCDPVDTKVPSQADCLQDDAVCYQRSACGITIWCTGPDADGGPSFPPPPPAPPAFSLPRAR